MIEELTKYYFDMGLLSTNFHCPYFDQCAHGYSGLITGKSAYIGKEYERHSLPRILFVSLDPGSDSDFETPEMRTPQGVRRIEENRNWEKFNPLLHWSATHRFGLKIAQVFEPQLTSKDANHIFAHTNSAKCCAKKDSHDMSGNVLYRNCRNFLHDEIGLLDPDILIAQGSKAHEAISLLFTDLSSQEEFKAFKSIHDRVFVYQVNHPVLYIQSVYPSWRNDRTRKQENELFPYYLDAVKSYAPKINST